MNFKKCIISKVRWIQEDKYCYDSISRRIPRIGKFTEIENRINFAKNGKRRENGELLSNGYRVSFWDDEKVLEMDNLDNCTTLVNILNDTDCIPKKD